MSILETEKKLFTVADCRAMEGIGILSPDERVELIRGEILLVSAPGPRHGVAVDGTARVFVLSVQHKAVVRVQGGVEFDAFNAPLPDIALLRPPIDRYLERNPGDDDILLIVEVAESSLKRDRTIKLRLYAGRGIPEYWIADLTTNQLIVYSNPDGKTYRSERILHRGDTVAPMLLPDCRIAVDLLLP